MQIPLNGDAASALYALCYYVNSGLTESKANYLQPI